MNKLKDNLNVYRTSYESQFSRNNQNETSKTCSLLHVVKPNIELTKQLALYTGPNQQTNNVIMWSGQIHQRSDFKRRSDEISKWMEQQLRK